MYHLHGQNEKTENRKGLRERLRRLSAMPIFREKILQRGDSLMDFCKKLVFFNRRAVAFMMAFILALSSVQVQVFAEGTLDEGPREPIVTDAGAPGNDEDPPKASSTPDPTDPPSAPFQQTVTLDDVRFVISAPAGVIIPGAEITVERKKDEEAEKAVLKTLELERVNEWTLIRHKLYLFSGASLNGQASVKIEKLGFTDLQKEYPEASISVYVLRCSPDEPVPADRAKNLNRELNLEQNMVSFFVTSLGLYDVVTVIRQPEPTPTPEPTEEPTPTPEPTDP